MIYELISCMMREVTESKGCVVQIVVRQLLLAPSLISSHRALKASPGNTNPKQHSFTGTESIGESTTIELITTTK